MFPFHIYACSARSLCEKINIIPHDSLIHQLPNSKISSKISIRFCSADRLFFEWCRGKKFPFIFLDWTWYSHPPKTIKECFLDIPCIDWTKEQLSIKLLYVLHIQIQMENTLLSRKTISLFSPLVFTKNIPVGISKFKLMPHPLKNHQQMPVNSSQIKDSPSLQMYHWMSLSWSRFYEAVHPWYLRQETLPIKQIHKFYKLKRAKGLTKHVSKNLQTHHIYVRNVITSTAICLQFMSLYSSGNTPSKQGKNKTIRKCRSTYWSKRSLDIST